MIAPASGVRAALALAFGTLLLAPGERVEALSVQQRTEQTSGTPRAPAPPVSAPAADDTASQVTRVVRAFLHNDLFALRDSGAATDFDYTSGVGAEIHWADAPGVLRRVGRDRPGCSGAMDRRTGCVRAMLGLSQQIYTPATNSAVPVPGQRPHAGALTLSAGAEWVDLHRRRSVQVDVGTTGRPALARPVQGLFHEITGTQRELGWDNQLAARLLIGVRYDELYHADATALGAHLRTRVNWGAEAGTRRVLALAGAEVQLGVNRRRFWTPTDGAEPLPLGPYLVGGLRQEYRLRDLLVDGDGRSGSSTAVRVPGVWQTTVGLGWRFAGGHSEYRHVRRGAEYQAQVAPHAFGALVFTFYH